LNAVRASAEVVGAIFGVKDPPVNLPVKYRVAKKKHCKRVLAGLTIFLAGSVLSFLLSLSLLPLGILISGFAGLAIVASDKEFYKIKEEAKWYNIE